MQPSYKTDARFQAIMGNILASVSTLQDKEDTRLLMGNLIDLRVSFVTSSWIFSKITKLDKKSSSWRWRNKEKIESFDSFIKLRDSKEAQVFLTKNPYFFAHIDKEIFSLMRDAVVNHIEEDLYNSNPDHF